MELKYGTGFYRRCQGTRHSKKGPSLAATVWKTGRPLSILDIQQWPGRARDCSDGWDEVQAAAGLPLCEDYGVIAVIGVGFPIAGHVLTEAHILEWFGKMASVALQYNDDEIKVKNRTAKRSYGLPALIGREATVLKRMTAGLSNQEIAGNCR